MQQEEEKKETFEEKIRGLPVSDHLFLMMHSLSDLALLRLGIVGDTQGKAINLQEAQLAIDAYKSLLEVVERVCSREETVPRRHVLAQLQLAYAAVVEKQAGERTEEKENASEDKADNTETKG
ncbi:MAG: DUF1844 domain-containing protein [Thermoleophilia bacterium]|nr:DUF1844 domain-containing protein [Thermoleophilia bacterium]